MKTMLQPGKNERGVALVVALIFAVLCAVTLGSYLVLVSSDGTMVNRSQDWNCALAYAEAGVDEALAQINASPKNFAANNWGGGGGTYGPVTRNLANGYYTVTIVGDVAPTIYSTGFVNVAVSGQRVARAV
jgi:Tfp pilus assembly protein PilX